MVNVAARTKTVLKGLILGVAQLEVLIDFQNIKVYHNWKEGKFAF